MYNQNIFTIAHSIILCYCTIGESKMIEADVTTGHLIDESEVEGQNTERIPIMAHPPAITSDLSLQEFLDEWSKTEKLLKLDFKSTEAFMLALPVMENAFTVINFFLFDRYLILFYIFYIIILET